MSRGALIKWTLGVTLVLEAGVLLLALIWTLQNGAERGVCAEACQARETDVFLLLFLVALPIALIGGTVLAGAVLSKVGELVRGDRRSGLRAKAPMLLASLPPLLLVGIPFAAWAIGVLERRG